MSIHTQQVDAPHLTLVSLLSMRTDVLPQQNGEHQRVRILLRTTVLATTWLVGVLGIAQVSGGDGGANIGIGLLMFALLIAAAGVWGAADGARQAYAQVAVTWVTVAVLMGLLVPVFTYLTESGSSWRALISDMVQGAPFIAVLITAPALLGGLLGRSTSNRSRDDGPG